MADLQLQAAKVSSLARALEGSVDLKHDVPAVPKSNPMKGFETLIIRSQSALKETAPIVHNITLPKMGQIVSMFAKYTFNNLKSKGLAAARPFAAKEGPALAATQLVRLLSNSRELSRMTSQDILIKVSAMPAETRDALLRMNGNHLHADVYMVPGNGNNNTTTDPLGIHWKQTATRPLEVLCPLPFACAFPGAGAAGQIDASFLEELQVEITTRPWQEAFGFTDPVNIAPSDANGDVTLDLVVNYSQMDDKHRQKMIAAAYKPGKPLQILSTSYELLGSQEIEKSAITTKLEAGNFKTFTTETFKFRSSSSCMARAIHYYVSANDGQIIPTAAAAVTGIKGDVQTKFKLRKGNTFAPIRQVKFSSGGRQVFKVTPETALAASLDRRYGGIAFGGTVADHASGGSVTYRFAKDDDASRFSGAMALAGASSQEHEVTADLPRIDGAIDENAHNKQSDMPVKFTCRAVAEKVVVYSISPSDGSIKVSLST